METFNFQEALSYIEAGLTVSLTLDGHTRSYKLNEKGEIICTPAGKEFLTYKVKSFYVDAVLSNNWTLDEI
jgi:hypothetical protein